MTLVVCDVFPEKKEMKTCSGENNVIGKVMCFFVGEFIFSSPTSHQFFLQSPITTSFTHYGKYLDKDFQGQKSQNPHVGVG